MWIQVGSPNLSDQFDQQLRKLEPTAPPVTETSQWLNLATGVIVILVTFGDVDGREPGFLRVFHWNPCGVTLLNVTYAFTKLQDYELGFDLGKYEAHQYNVVKRSQVERLISARLGLP